MKKMTVILSKVRLGRVLLAAIAAHVLSVVFAALAAVAAVAVGSPSDSALVAGLAGRMATWSVPVLTFFAAAWVVRTAERGTSTLHGLLVGLLGAVFFGVHYYWPFDLAALAMHVLVIAAGWLGSMVGTRRDPWAKADVGAMNHVPKGSFSAVRRALGHRRVGGFFSG